jgi:hypothetical protein
MNLITFFYYFVAGCFKIKGGSLSWTVVEFLENKIGGSGL